MENAKPKSHGNYVESLEVAEKVIQDELDYFRELDADDTPAFTLVFISDGRPSDNLPDQKGRRNGIMTRLANTLKSKLTFLGMGVSSNLTFDNRFWYFLSKIYYIYRLDLLVRISRRCSYWPI